MAESETWRPVVGFEGFYEVSDMGRVRSIDHFVPHGRWGGDHMRLMRGRILKSPAPEFYPIVRLSRPGGIYKTRQVHRLVTEAFIGPCPDGLIVCHNNGNPLDNRIENLRYDTWSSNNFDTAKHGNHWQVRKTHCVNGHEYTDENTIIRVDGGRRRCRKCSARRG